MHPLVVENVLKTFRQGDRTITALDGVSLEVVRGRLLAVMGASGSGKSTLLHVMAALTRADSGRVVVDGHDLTALPDGRLTLFRRRHIGLVFQAFNLIPTLSAAENVSLPLLLDGHSPREVSARADGLLDRLGLSHRREHRPDVMSGGEQQRVAIGRALVTDPAVILADEPTGNLDSVNSRAVCELLRDLAVRDGKTIVLVTHEPSVAAYAHEVAIMKDGRIVGRISLDKVSGGSELANLYQQAIA